MAYSVSRIKVFKSCPNCYRLGYLLGLEQEPPTPALIKGTQTHEAFEHLDESNEIVNNFIHGTIGEKLYPIIKPSEKEKKFGIKVVNEKLVPSDFEDCDFHGIIDVLYNNIILDYKTGKIPEKIDWKQLGYYALWLFLSSDYEEIHVSYLYVEHNVQKSMVLPRSCLHVLESALLRDINELKEYDANPKEIYNTSWKCRFCSVKKHCKRYLGNLETMHL